MEYVPAVEYVYILNVPLVQQLTLAIVASLFLIGGSFLL